MNLKKYTKAELISKINGLKQNNNNPTFFSKTLGFILLFKSFILKFTLIAIIVKRFKKIVNKKEEIVTDILTEEEIPLYRNKYIIIAGILILSGLGYYF